MKKAEIKEVTVKIDGKEIPINQFVTEIIGHTILGMISPLREVGNPRKIEIKVELECS
jgi:hypothetical protein